MTAEYSDLIKRLPIRIEDDAPNRFVVSRLSIAEAETLAASLAAAIHQAKEAK